MNFTEKQIRLHQIALTCLAEIKVSTERILYCEESFKETYLQMRAEAQIHYSEIMEQLMKSILDGSENNAKPSPLHDIFENMLNQYSPEKN